MPISISRRALLGSGVAAAAMPRRARAADKPIRIGVLTDMAGPYAANTGVGSVLGAQMAVEDVMRNNPSIKAEVVQADLQLKPDVAVAITRDWFDNQGVDVEPVARDGDRDVGLQLQIRLHDFRLDRRVVAHDVLDRHLRAEHRTDTGVGGV